MLAQLPNQGETIHRRQHAVQDECLVDAFDRHRQRGFTIGDAIHDMTALCQAPH